MDRNESIRISMHYKQLFISTNNYHLRLNIPRTVYHPHSLSLSLSLLARLSGSGKKSKIILPFIFSQFSSCFFFNNSRQQLRLILKDGERRRKKLKDATKVSHSSSSATYTDTPLFSFSSCS